MSSERKMSSPLQYSPKYSLLVEDINLEDQNEYSRDSPNSEISNYSSTSPQISSEDEGPSTRILSLIDKNEKSSSNPKEPSSPKEPSPRRPIPSSIDEVEWKVVGPYFDYFMTPLPSKEAFESSKGVKRKAPSSEIEVKKPPPPPPKKGDILPSASRAQIPDSKEPNATNSQLPSLLSMPTIPFQLAPFLYQSLPFVPQPNYFNPFYPQLFNNILLHQQANFSLSQQMISSQNNGSQIPPTNQEPPYHFSS